MQRPLRVSLVIPAYNEESHIAACLDAVALLRPAPFEVIVVDNNCSDDTAAIAGSYNFVRVVREPRQGLVFARDTGFNVARGEIIGRIDADTLLSADWIATLRRLFADETCGAVSGSVVYYDVPLRRTVGRIDLWFRETIARKLGDEVYLFGANMAIRRSVWLAVQGTLCHERQLHEDFDLAVHLADLGERAVRFEPALHAGVSARCMDYNPRTFYHYVLANPRTYAAHGRRSQRCMYRLVVFMLVMYVPLRFFYRASDPRDGHFSPRYLFMPNAPHASPLTEPPLF